MTFFKIGTVVASFGLMALASCAPQQPPIIAQTTDVDAFAISLLNDLQPRSIAEDREYCGYIYATETGGIAATAPHPGAEDYCDLPWPDDQVIASYHTHGSFSRIYENEVPSTDDIMGDFDAEIDGYISTPGGRVWINDFDRQVARQLCNLSCVTADPNNDPNDAGFVPQTFTINELRARLE